MISFLMKGIMGVVLALSLLPTCCMAQLTSNVQHESFEQKFESARLVFHRTCFEEAAILFDTLINEKPNHALSYAYAAMIDMLLYKDPSQHVEKAKSLSKITNVDHSFTLALCSFASGNLGDCEVNMKTFLTNNPDHIYALHVLGFTQSDLGRPEDGKKTLEHLIAKSPSYFPAYNHLGYAYLGLNENNNAMNAFEEYLKNDKLNPSAMDSYAEGLSAIKDYDKAIAYLAKAVLLEPNFAYGWKHLGDILIQNGEIEIALLAYEKAKDSAKMYGADFIKTIENKIKSLKD